MSWLSALIGGRRKAWGRYTRAELDREYSPSSCVDSIDPYLKRYATLSAEARWRAESTGRCQLDLSYGVGAAQTLDLFLPSETGRGPLQVYVHGGYWQMLSVKDSAFAAPMFQRAGSYFAALGYTLAPAARLGDIVEECRQAIEWLYRHAGEYGADRERIHLSGSSAGAHLCAMLLNTNWPARGLPRDVVKGACLVSGVYDLEPIRHTYVDEPLHLDDGDVASLSPLRLVPGSHCPVLIAHGSLETDEFKRQSRDYHQHLQRAGEEVQCREITGRNHFDVILDLCDDEAWLADAVLRQMALRPADNEHVLYRP